jgi:hypothetical protein
MFTGWSCNGILTCPICGGDTDCFRVKYGGNTTEKRHSFVGFFIFVGADVDISNYVHRFLNRRM